VKLKKLYQITYYKHSSIGFRKPCGPYNVFTVYGALHREDGPAIISRDGSKTWYTNGMSIGHTIPQHET